MPIKWVEEKVPSMVMMVKGASSEIQVFRSACGLVVLKSVDVTPRWGKLKHISISRADRYPSWDEILEAKEFIFGDVDCMMIMPKKENYVNVMKNCFHVWQTPEGWEIG